MTRPLLRVLRALFGLSLREIADLVVAQQLLLGALWTVRRRQKGALLRPVIVGASQSTIVDEPRLQRMAVAIDRVARFGLFRPTCLVRAVALERIIARNHSGAAVVRVGVLAAPTAFLAHAWIELDGRVIGDELARTSQFTPLHDFSALAR